MEQNEIITEVSASFIQPGDVVRHPGTGRLVEVTCTDQFFNRSRTRVLHFEGTGLKPLKLASSARIGLKVKTL